MTSTETATPYEVTYRKADHRYYVDLDGVQVGWVSKGRDGWWSFFATTSDGIQGDRKSTERQRWSAVEAGLCLFRIYDLGRMLRLDMDRDSDTYMKDVPVYFDRDRLKATQVAMTDKHYGF